MSITENAQARDEFMRAVKQLTVIAGGRLKLGNVEFFIDDAGPWKGELAYDTPTSKWDAEALSADLAELLRMRGAPPCVTCREPVTKVGLIAIEARGEQEATRFDCPNGHTILVVDTAELQTDEELEKRSLFMLGELAPSGGDFQLPNGDIGEHKLSATSSEIFYVRCAGPETPEGSVDGNGRPVVPGRFYVLRSEPRGDEFVSRSFESSELAYLALDNGELL